MRGKLPDGQNGKICKLMQNDGRHAGGKKGGGVWV